MTAAPPTGSLAVVMPVHDEAAGLTQVIDDAARQILDLVEDSRMIAVDDCSSDATPAILAAAAAGDDRIEVVTNEFNAGHGPAVRRGIDHSSSEWILHIDSDGQLDLSDFSRLWNRRHESDLILGVRADRNDPRHRLIVTAVTRVVCSALARSWILDANTPFKLFRRSLFDHVQIPTDTFAPSVMLAIGAARSGARINEVDIAHLARPHGQSTLHPARLARALSASTAQSLTFAARRFEPYRP